MADPVVIGAEESTLGSISIHLCRSLSTVYRGVSETPVFHNIST